MIKYEFSCESESTTSVVGFGQSRKVENETQDEDALQNLSQRVAAIPGPAGLSDFSSISELSKIPPCSGEESKSATAVKDEKRDEMAPRCRLEIVLADPPSVGDGEVDPNLQLQHNETSSTTSSILSVECTSCERKVPKYGALNKLTCVCGHSVCYICRDSVPDGSYRAAYEHFCLHERYNSNRPCRQCRSCDLYDADEREEEIMRVRSTNGENVLMMPDEAKDWEKSQDVSLVGSKSGKVNIYGRFIQDTSTTRHERWVSRQLQRVALARGSTSSLKDEHNTTQRGVNLNHVVVDLTTIYEDIFQERQEGDAPGRDAETLSQERNLSLILCSIDEQMQQSIFSSDHERISDHESPLRKNLVELGEAKELRGDKVNNEIIEFELGHISDSDDEDEAISGREREQALQSGELKQNFNIFNQDPNDLNSNAPANDVHHAGKSMELHGRKYFQHTRGESENQTSSTSLPTSRLPGTSEDKKVSGDNEIGDKSSCNLESRIAEVTSRIPETRSRKRKEPTPIEERITLSMRPT